MRLGAGRLRAHDARRAWPAPAGTAAVRAPQGRPQAVGRRRRATRALRWGGAALPARRPSPRRDARAMPACSGRAEPADAPARTSSGSRRRLDGVERLSQRLPRLPLLMVVIGPRPQIRGRVRVDALIVVRASAVPTIEARRRARPIRVVRCLDEVTILGLHRTKLVALVLNEVEQPPCSNHHGIGHPRRTFDTSSVVSSASSSSNARLIPVATRNTSTYGRKSPTFAGVMPDAMPSG